MPARHGSVYSTGSERGLQLSSIFVSVQQARVRSRHTRGLVAAGQEARHQSGRAVIELRWI